MAVQAICLIDLNAQHFVATGNARYAATYCFQDSGGADGLNKAVQFVARAAQLHGNTVLAGMSVEHWINDGLMAIFFMLVGLEIKREMLAGQLASWSQRALPGFAALGGMVVPALI